ncbi:MAG: hypothetical protein H3C51_01595 [Rubellimicrobium sp.]|nr:hypothetical protein [Rubellimicrobium sp.]
MAARDTGARPDKSRDKHTRIDWRRDWPRLLGGLVVTLGVVLATAWFSARPDWQSLPEGNAVLRVSFAYSGERDCRDRTEEEIAALPRNMRTAQECSRRRNPVGVAILIDGDPIFDEVVKPSGLAGSGPSRLYESFVLPAGDHEIAVTLRANGNEAEVTHAADFTLALASGEAAAIDFDATAEQFVLR